MYLCVAQGCTHSAFSSEVFQGSGDSFCFFGPLRLVDVGTSFFSRAPARLFAFSTSLAPLLVHGGGGAVRHLVGLTHSPSTRDRSLKISLSPPHRVAGMSLLARRPTLLRFENAPP